MELMTLLESQKINDEKYSRNQVSLVLHNILFLLISSKESIKDIENKIRQLERHFKQLQKGESPNPESHEASEFAKFLMPSDIKCPDWSEFDNVYQAHCPKFR
jgi:hypothetical protein